VEHQLNYLHLCPVCLRKLHWNIGFDIPTHYARLLNVFQAYEDVHENFTHDCTFLRQRMKALQDVEPGVTVISDLVPKSKTSSSEIRNQYPLKSAIPKAQAKRSGSAASLGHAVTNASGKNMNRNRSQNVEAEDKAVASSVKPARASSESPASHDSASFVGLESQTGGRRILERQIHARSKFAPARQPSHVATVVSQISNRITGAHSPVYAPEPKKTLSRNGGRVLPGLPRGSQALSGSMCACCAPNEDSATNEENGLVCPSCD